MSSELAPRAPLARIAIVAVVWLAVERLLALRAARLLPPSIAEHFSLQTWLVTVEIVAMAFGLCLAWGLLIEPRRELGLVAPRGKDIGVVALAAPIVFVIVTVSAFRIAMPTLLDELLSGGLRRAQENTGEFGRALTATPAWITIGWGVAVAPVAEELMFRGALWTLAQGLVARLAAGRASTASLPTELLEEGWMIRALRSSGRFFASGGAATVVTTAIFGALHADLEGGAGIMRTVSATGLGFAAGTARQLTGGLAAPIALHSAFNLMSIATTRRWLTFDGLPMKQQVPTLLMGVAALCAVLLALAAILWARHSRSRQHRPPVE